MRMTATLRTSAAIGGAGILALGLALGSAAAQSSGTGGSSEAATKGQPGKVIAPGANTGIGATPIEGSNANGNGNVVQGTTGGGGTTGTSGPKAVEPDLTNK